MRNGDGASPSIILAGKQNREEATASNIWAGRALLVKMLITLDRMLYVVPILYNYVFYIVQQLVCKTVTRLHQALFMPVELS